MLYVMSVLLKGTGYPVDFPAIFHKGDNFCDFLFVFLHINRLLYRGLLQ